MSTLTFTRSHHAAPAQAGCHRPWASDAGVQLTNVTLYQCPSNHTSCPRDLLDENSQYL